VWRLEQQIRAPASVVVTPEEPSVIAAVFNVPIVIEPLSEDPAPALITTFPPFCVPAVPVAAPPVIVMEPPVAAVSPDSSPPVSTNAPPVPVVAVFILG
jgi:hypothetical protein